MYEFITQCTGLKMSHHLMVILNLFFKKKRCSFLGTAGLGRRLKNNSFTHAKKLLLENKIDWYLRPENYLTFDENGEEGLFDLSVPVNTER